MTATVQPANPDHRITVPPFAGHPPYCSCGVVGGRGVDIDGVPLLADHVQAVGGWGDLT